MATALYFQAKPISHPDGYRFWRILTVPRRSFPRALFPCGTRDEMRRIDLQTGQYTMIGPASRLPAGKGGAA